METIKLKIGNQEIEASILNDEIDLLESKEKAQRLEVYFILQGPLVTDRFNNIQEKAKKHGVQTIGINNETKEWVLASWKSYWKADEENSFYEIRWTLEDR